MMKWLHLPWHIEGNRVIKTATGETIIRFAPGVVSVEENRNLQLACDQVVYARGERPWILLDDVLQLILAAGYKPIATAA